MVDIAGGYDPNAEAQTEFEPVPVGKYVAVIEEGDIEDVSRNNDYGSCLKLTWKITEGEYENRLIWQRLNLWGQNMKNNDLVIQIANSQMAAIREATGVIAPRDTDELLHIPCLISVSIRKDKTGQYADQNEIKGVKPAAHNQAQATGMHGASPTWKQADRPPAKNTPAQKTAASNTAGNRPWKKPVAHDEAPF